MTDQECIKAYPTAKFIGFIRVGNRGCAEYYFDKVKYEARRDRVWDSGHDFECRIIKE